MLFNYRSRIRASKKKKTWRTKKKKKLSPHQRFCKCLIKNVAFIKYMSNIIYVWNYVQRVKAEKNDSTMCEERTKHLSFLDDRCWKQQKKVRKFRWIKHEFLQGKICWEETRNNTYKHLLTYMETRAKMFAYFLYIYVHAHFSCFVFEGRREGKYATFSLSMRLQG